ncbi:M20/M25/M40 family metallo-hydrolase [Candidatus Bathyarchaeota archaeon]|nr:M20/M25/M40 family metallo-hydrolase [Candidatus Bathyarchaeota archaeon]
MSKNDEESSKIEIPDERRQELFELARTLTGFCSPTGFEDRIRKYLVQRLKDRCEVTTDAMGNVMARIQGTGTSRRLTLMMAAHVDEIGFMVSFVTSDGFLRIVPLGGQNIRILPGQRVTIFHEDLNDDIKEITGVIAEKPIHLLSSDERKKLVKQEELFVDIGVHSKEEALEIISIGDHATFTRQCDWLGPGKVFSCKAGDDRMGVLVELLVLEHFIEHPPPVDIVATFTVQEEIGTRGAIPSSFTIDPDMAIVLEVTHAIDFPGISKEKFGDVSLGKGPAIAVGPNLHPRMTRFIIRHAREAGIPHQVEVENRPTGTDARAIQVTRGGVATALVSIPLRYMHTNIEVIDPIDLDAAIALITGVIEKLPGDALPLNL